MAPKTPPFAGAGPPFSVFLERTGKTASLGDSRFLARNFLLDEGAVETRLESYARAGAAADHADVSAWAGRHDDYLKRFVFLDQPAGGAPETVNPTHPSCPETFRHPEAFRSLGLAHPDLDLVRVVSVGGVVRKLPAGLATETELVAWAHEALATKDPDSAAWQALEAALAEWHPRLDLRPVFAGFWQEQKDLLDGGPPDWADVLRDRLGLLHLSPRRPGQELPIFVFRYPIRRIPRRLGLRDERALAVPTVLDGQLSEAFCPAPMEDAYGRAGFDTFITGNAGDAATLTPSSDSDIKIEVWLPTNGWNSKLLGVGKLLAGDLDAFVCLDNDDDAHAALARSTSRAVT